MTQIHPEAKRRFDERGELLVAGETGAPVTFDHARTQFVPDVPISGILSSADLLGPLKQTSFDPDGYEVGRFAGTRDGSVLFEGKDHSELRDLAKSIQRTGHMRDSVNLETVVDWIIEWSLDRRLGRSPEPLTDYLVGRRKEAVACYQFTVPLHEPYIEIPFELGSTRLRPLNSQELEAWFELPPGIPDKHYAATAERMVRRRRDLQGRTAVVVELEAEQNFAKEIAWNRAETTAAILRVASKGMFFPNARTNCVPLGTAVSERQQFITHRNGELLGWSESVLDPESLGNWSLDRRMISQDLEYWSGIARLLDNETPTEFERDLSRAYLLYSRVALTRDVSEKLVHLFAALESLLLRSESEPIQSAISERLAFVVGDDATQRAEIARLLRSVYSLRSRFVHHGREPAEPRDLQAIKQLLYFAWRFFFQAISVAQKFSARNEFLDQLELRKWQ